MLAGVGRNCVRAATAVLAIIPVIGCERSFEVKMENRSSAPVLVHQDGARGGRVAASRSAAFPRKANDTTLDMTVESATGGRLGDLRISPEEKHKAVSNHLAFDLIWDGKTLRSR